MKKFNQYLQESAYDSSQSGYSYNPNHPVFGSKTPQTSQPQPSSNRPGGAINDRSLEGFRPILDQLAMQMKGVINPAAKQELQQLVNNFYREMQTILTKYNKQGVGYSPRYQPNQNA